MEIVNIDYIEPEVEERISKYAHDSFFHYLMINHDELRLMLCQKMVSEATLVSTEVISSELYGDFENSKRFVLDIVAKDEEGNFYNLELQCYDIDDEEFARFQAYGFKLIANQSRKGEMYSSIKKVRQMIINAAHPIKGLNNYYHYFTIKDEEGTELPHSLYEIHLIQTAYLNIEENDDVFDQLMYLFQNNKVYDKIMVDRKIEEAVAMHKKYIKSEEWVVAAQRERDRIALNTHKERALRKGREEGLAEGREEGLAEGRTLGVKQMIASYVEKLFNEDITEWLDSLNDEQLEIVEKNIFTIHNIEELKKMLV